jgi:GTPase SAR1 family protein
MAFINYTSNSLTIKIVYYGPVQCGKTSNLRYVHENLDPASRGQLICLETETERTFFFDLLPIKAGYIGCFRVHFQLMSAPGQEFYEASRRNVLTGADGLVFVADSQAPFLEANVRSLESLRRNMEELRFDPAKVPIVFQYNKRDLDNLTTIEALNAALNPNGAPFLEASAVTGRGIFETLKEIARATTPRVRDKIFGLREGSPPGVAGALSAKDEPELI